VAADLGAAERAPYTAALVGFARALRSEGLGIGTGDAQAFCAAMAPLDPTDMIDVYWAGRSTMTTRQADIEVYDRVFRSYFLGAATPAGGKLPAVTPQQGTAVGVLNVPANDVQEGNERSALQGVMAAGTEVLRHTAFARCTPDELAALRRVMASMRLIPPRRRTRRTVAGGRGHRPDLRRTIRQSMRMCGEPAELYWRSRKLRLRPLILILDVSGSMADYSRCLLQFAYAARRAANRVEVFCFGTRLTRITRALEHQRPDEALDRAAQTVVDWAGGTRIGSSLDTFVKTWARQGICRGGIVVICSDGLDRGDPAVLSAAMERLARLSHRIVWMNPHRGSDRSFTPSTLGMIVAAPHTDMILSGHDLASLEQLAEMLPALN
jgi:uncharacterized protein with von Willebrand factor type A (vWA) domain